MVPDTQPQLNLTPYVRVLGELHPDDRLVAGEKAWNLDCLIKLGYPVPPGICLLSTFPTALIRIAQQHDKFIQYLQPGINHSTLLRELFLTLTVTQELVSQLQAWIQPLGDVVIVRSSSPREDALCNSKAGYFQSFLNVSTSDTYKVWHMIRLCWISAFSPLALTGTGRPTQPENIGVIIQRQINADKSGICFSQDPIRRSTSEVIIEATDGTGQALASGQVRGDLYRVLRTEQRQTEETEGILHSAEVNKLYQWATHLEQEWGHPVDLEWGITGETFYLFQIRPITTPTNELASVPPHLPCYVDINDLDHLAQFDLNDLLDILQARTAKRYYVYQTAKRHGIDFKREGFLIISRGTLDGDAVAQALAHLRTSIVEVAVEKHGWQRVRQTDLLKWLETHMQKEQDRLQPIFVAEFFDNELSGYATRLPDGTFLVEYIPGGFGGFIVSNLPYSRVWLNSNGQILDQLLQPAELLWRLNPITLNMEPVRMPLSNTHLTPAILQAVKHMTEVMSTAFGEVRIEWLHAQGHTVLWDLSIENKELSEGLLETSMLSRGYAHGPAHVITDFEDIDRIAFDRSVIIDAGFYVAYHSQEASEVRKRLKVHTSPPIIVAPYPRPSLALYLNDVAGFIFDHGALLCHFGIILREAGVPAIFVSNATSRFETGDPIEFLNGHLISTRI